MKKHNNHCRSNLNCDGHPTPSELSTSAKVTLAIRIGDENWVKSLLYSPDSEFDVHRGNYICQAAESGHVGILMELLASGADPNEQNFYGEKWPVHICAKRGHFEILKVLVHNGADINQLDGHLRTAMHFVALRGHEEMVKWMVDHGALADEAELDGYSPLHTASCLGYDSVCHRLLALGGADLTRKSKDGWSSLHMAVSFGHLKTCEVLLSFGADPEERTPEGETTLHMACAKGYTELVQLLLHYGASVNPSNNHGETPLHKAMHSGHLKAAYHLILSGASINFLHLPVTRTPCSCPLNFAGLRGDSAMVHLLVTAGCIVPRPTALLLHRRRNISADCRDEVSRFPSLTELCIWIIRGLLAPDLQKKAPLLPLPAALRNTLALHHLKKTS